MMTLRRSAPAARLGLITALATGVFLTCDACGYALTGAPSIVIAYSWQFGRTYLLAAVCVAVVAELILSRAVYDVKKVTVVVAMAASAVLLVLDPYTHGLTGSDELFVVLWPKIVASFQIVVLLVAAGLHIGEHFGLGRTLLWIEVATFCLTNTFFMYRDGWLRFGTDSGALMAPVIILVLGLILRGLSLAQTSGAAIRRSVA
jgi:hypothetical protein